MIVALYARVSTVKQAEKDLSIPDQLRQMRDWCKRQGHAVAVEYVEPGASATDDRRPAFQQMMAEACRGPAPSARSWSIRSPASSGTWTGSSPTSGGSSGPGCGSSRSPSRTSEDSGGQMIRQVFSVFDQYQSEENGKHTLRAMNENARRGFFNGPGRRSGTGPAVELPGNKGKKRRLAVDEAEAVLVRKVFALYLHGDRGRALGFFGVARTLNRQGPSYRGQPWTKNRVEEILTDRVYIGEEDFNKTARKTGRQNPPGTGTVSDAADHRGHRLLGGGATTAGAPGVSRAGPGGLLADALDGPPEVRSLRGEHDQRHRKGGPVPLLQVQPAPPHGHRVRAGTSPWGRSMLSCGRRSVPGSSPSRACTRCSPRSEAW